MRGKTLRRRVVSFIPEAYLTTGKLVRSRGQILGRCGVQRVPFCTVLRSFAIKSWNH
jgi:hypothetical protein